MEGGREKVVGGVYEKGGMKKILEMQYTG